MRPYDDHLAPSPCLSLIDGEKPELYVIKSFRDFTQDQNMMV